MKQQQGITLFIVIIVMVVATSLAAAVLTETRLGLNSIGFTQDKMANEQALLSGVDKIITNNELAAKVMALEVNKDTTMESRDYNTKATITLQGESYCKRSDSASSINIISCKFARIQFEHNAGKNSRVQGSSMTAGIEQPFLAANNN